VLVGDTPLDVAAALEGGARAVGVATGPYDTQDLRESGAHVVLADLTDLDSVLEAVLG
jgi:phosphoglycolate phosphatase-like HAD superfamily hydrolase